MGRREAGDRGGRRRLGSRHGHGLRPGHRPTPAGLRGGRVRGVSGQDVRRPDGPRARRLSRRERGGSPGCRAADGRRRRGARQSPRHGPGDPRAGRPSVRGEDPRVGARVHGQAARRALSAVRPRGDGCRLGGARRIRPHRGEPLGGAGRSGGSEQDAPRSAGRRHRAVLADPALGGGAPAARARGRAACGTRRRFELGSRSGGGGSCHRGVRRRHRPPRRLHRQADRLEGCRSFAGGLAACPRCEPRSPSASSRIRGVRGDDQTALGRSRDRRPGHCPRDRGARPRSGGRGGGAASDALGVPRRPAARLRRERPGRDRDRGLRRAPRARRGRQARADCRCAGHAEHLSRVVRDGGGRGGRGRDTAGVRQPLGDGGGEPGARGGPAVRRVRPGLLHPRRRGRTVSGRPHHRLAGPGSGNACRGSCGPPRGRGQPVELGGSRPDDPGRVGGRARGPSGAESAACHQVRFRPEWAPNRAIECRAVTRATLARIIAAIVVLTVVMAVPMTQIHWNGTEASTQAHDIDTLLNVMIILSCFVFSIVLVMLGYCVWKYRAKPGDESDGEPIHGNTKLEITWTVIPTVIVLFGAIYSWIVLGNIESQAADDLKINVTAQQYEWTFNYPQPNGKVVSSKVLVVPDGRQLDLTLTSLDVLHSFWVPEWRIKRDLVPKGPGGNDVDDTVVVTPDKVGTYNVVCTELCGFGHATMRALVKVVPPNEFETWLKKQPQLKPLPGSPNSASTGTSSQDQSVEGTTTTTPQTTSTTGSG